MSRHILHEHAAGYVLFDLLEHDSIATVAESVLDPSKFGKTCKMVAFAPFKNAKEALENCQDVAEGKCSDFLQNFLEMNIAQKASYNLGVAEKQLAASIKLAMGIECTSDDVVAEATRGIRMHFAKIIKQLSSQDMERAQLGLGHSFSRAKVRFNVNRSDNMILQASALMDELDKDVNVFAMRIREWYSWHFPELVKVVPENHLFARVVKVIGDKSTLTADKLPQLEEIVGDETKAQAIIDAANTSMGTDISAIDMININSFADRVISITEYRKQLQTYLHDKMGMVAPNLAGLIGDTVGARLIRHAGSLSNLSKYPASTVQILGAEKALFRALKTKGNTPKYGLIYHSTFIGRAGAKNKGRISRYLANKCSIASRIDCYSELPSSLYGDAMRDQVEERLAFYETGKKPARNADVMNGVTKDMMDIDHDNDEPSSKKRPASEIAPPATTPAKKSKKSKADKELIPESEVKEKKSEKKSKKEASAETPAETPKDKKKKQKDLELQVEETPKVDKKEKKDKKDKSAKKEKKSKSKD